SVVEKLASISGRGALSAVVEMCRISDALSASRRVIDMPLSLCMRDPILLWPGRGDVSWKSVRKDLPGPRAPTGFRCAVHDRHVHSMDGAPLDAGLLFV